MIIYAYGDRAAPVWFEQNKTVIRRFDNLHIISVSDESVEAMAGIVERTMTLQCLMQDGAVMLSHSQGSMDITMDTWK